jgi:diguanylate cyclase (GGDEF)-like protein
VDVAARWGGEEFVVILPAVGREHAISPAQRILKAIAENAFPAIPGRTVTVSIGCASAPHAQVESAQQLVYLADAALYEAKRQGRNRIEAACEEQPEA